MNNRVDICAILDDYAALIAAPQTNKPKVTMDELVGDDGPIAALVNGPLFFREGLPSYGEAADILAAWLRSIGVDVEEK